MSKPIKVQLELSRGLALFLNPQGQVVETPIMANGAIYIDMDDVNIITPNCSDLSEREHAELVKQLKDES